MVKIPPLVSSAYSERLKRRGNSTLGEVWDLLDQVNDPEIPVLSLWDLGVLTDIEKTGDCIRVIITPTYSGCPAMDVMRSDIGLTLSAAGFENYSISTRLSPTWNTDMMSPEGRDKLRAYGIAPPMDKTCPHCGSSNTRNVSEFGSTACKALYQCRDCSEAFDYFKKI